MVQNNCYQISIESMLYKQGPLISKMPRMVSPSKILEISCYLLYYIFLKKDLPWQLLVANVWRAFFLVPLKYLSLIRRFPFKALFNNPTPISCCMPLPQCCGPNLASTGTGVSNQTWISGMCCNQ